MAKNTKSSETELRSRGYMTTEEFSTKLSSALSEYMAQYWSKSKDELHHPEDLMAAASTCITYLFFNFLYTA